MTMKKRHCRQLLNSRSRFPALVCSSWSLGATQMMFCILSLRAFKSKGNGSNMSVTANPKFTLICHISASDDVNLSCCSREFSQWEICFSWLFRVHFLTLMNANEQKHQWFSFIWHLISALLITSPFFCNTSSPDWRSGSTQLLSHIHLSRFFCKFV